MGENGFQASPEQLRRHAGAVDDVAGTFDAAAQAAGQTTLNTDAFGVIGQFLASAVIAKEAQVTGMVQQLAESTKSLADDVRSTAEDYENSDGAAVDALNQVRGV
ncbi:type VII secretion target [Salinifilum ghardaiensis]